MNETKHSVKRSIGLQTLYQIISISLPLLTTPYLSRVLGAENLGVFSYTSSIVAYFSLFAMLGTINYGTRSIALVSKNRNERSKIFFEVFSLQFLTSLIAIIAYCWYLVSFCTENQLVALLQMITLVSCLTDISWFYFGIENFKPTILCSMIFRIISVGLIFVFVREHNDLWKYTALVLSGTLLSTLSLWIFVPRYISLQRISIKSIFLHFKPNIILFIPLVAMSVYHTMDKTMLGLLSNFEQSGFYYNADKLINIPISILNGIGTVMLPRMSMLYSKENHEEANNVFLFSMEMITILGIAMAFGIAAISPEFVPLFFGIDFTECIELTVVLAPTLIIKGISNTCRTQYLVPLKKEKVFTKSVIGGAVVNLFLNILLIPRYGAMGAVVATLFAELVSWVYQILFVRKHIILKSYFLSSILYVLAGIVMCLLIRFCAGYLVLPLILKVVIEICIGVVCYIILCLMIWKITGNLFIKSFMNLV